MIIAAVTAALGIVLMSATVYGRWLYAVGINARAAKVARIPGARFAEIPGAGHLPNLENKEAFDAAVGAFMKRFPVEGLPREGKT